MSAAPVPPNDYAALPASLRALPRWGRWKMVPSPGTKPRKVPWHFCEDRPARTNHLEDWGPFDTAVAHTDGVFGLGFLFVAADGLVGVDLDDCANASGLSDAAMQIVADFDTYTEWSPSGRGVHLIGYGSLPDNKGRKGGGLEVYNDRRFFCCTGRVLDLAAGTVNDVSVPLAAFLAQHFAAASPAPAPVSNVAPLDKVARAAAYLRRVPAAISGQGGHDRTWAAALSIVVGFDLDETQAYALIADWNLSCQPPWSEAELRHKIRDASTSSRYERGYLLNKPLPPRATRQAISTSSALPAPQPAERPVVDLSPGRLADAVTEAHTALGAMREPHRVYQRGGILCVVDRADTPSELKSGRATFARRAAGAVLIRPLSTPALCVELARAARFERFNAKTGNMSDTDPPPKFASQVGADAGGWRVAQLAGVIEAPTLRPDMSVLETPGFDEATGLYLAIESGQFDPVPERPTRADAMTAIAEIDDLFSEFPFREPHHHAAAVAALLTALVRRSLSSAPLFTYSAPKMRSGKSTAADLVALMATGRICTTVTFTDDPVEEKKRLLALLMAGDPVVCFDNISGALTGDALCSIITQGAITDRLLGASQTVTVGTDATFLATGNNLTISGDMSVRVLPIELDPQLERPEERRFRRNLYEYVPANRHRLVPLALTALRAYAAAGLPDQGLTPWAGFADWSMLIRGALRWLDYDDPVAGRKAVESSDPIRDELSAVLAALRANYGTQQFTVADVLSLQGPGTETLRAALRDVASDNRGNLSGRRVGRYLRRYKGRIENGLKVEEMGDSREGRRWKLVSVVED